MTKPVVHADGIYFDMPEAEYHADPALGSSSMKRLRYSPADYWFDSPYNPLREEEDEKKSLALIKGSALHKFVLEGRGVFQTLYAPCEHPGNIKAGKEEREKIIASGRTPLPRRDYDAISQAGQMIRSNPGLANAFEGGHSEVSVFWTDRGIRKKARFDYLKIKSIVDLKSITNTLGIEFEKICVKALGQRNYLIQAAHYCEGRARMRDLLDNVQGDVDRDWLQRVAEEDPFAFTFVFWQSAGAPLTWGTYLTYPGNPLFEIVQTDLRIAEDGFLACMEQFGPDQPWLHPTQMAELDISEMPGWWGR